MREENQIREKGGGIESKFTEEYTPLWVIKLRLGVWWGDIKDFFYVEIVTSSIEIGFRASSLNFICILKSHWGMYDEPPTNKEGIQTNAELFVIQNIVV